MATLYTSRAFEAPSAKFARELRENARKKHGNGAKRNHVMGVVKDLTQIGVLRVVKAQALITAITAAATYTFYGSRPMFASLYGGLTVLLSSWWLANRLKIATAEMAKSAREADAAAQEDGEDSGGQAGRLADSGKTMGSLVLFAGLAQRLLFIGAAFAYGIGYLGLPPMPMIVTFALASVGNVFVGRD
jgi:hypothetical protein